MALRIIDNAFPVPQERPKKQAKVSIPIQKRLGNGVNDENNPVVPMQQPVESAVDYISSHDLKPLSDPESKIDSLIEGLASKDWTKVCESLNNARQFAIHHSSLLLPILEKVMVVLVKAMKNPRSALCKTSIMASSDIFKAFGGKLLEDNSNSKAFHDLLIQLLMKASQDKKFVCEEAERALDVMVSSMAPLPLLDKLRAYVSHNNLRVRAKAAVSLSNCVSKMGLEEMEEFGLVQMVQMAADLLNDRLPEAREASRSIVSSVYERFTTKKEEKQEAWQNFCQTNLTAINAQAMIKIVSSQ